MGVRQSGWIYSRTGDAMSRDTSCPRCGSQAQNEVEGIRVAGQLIADSFQRCEFDACRYEFYVPGQVRPVRETIVREPHLRDTW